METLNNYCINSKSRIIIYVPTFPLSHWSISQLYIHSWLLEQLFGITGAFRIFNSHRQLSLCRNKLFKMRVTGGIIRIKNDFKEASRNFILTVIPIKQQKN
jgi:hypothetical protein